MTELEPSDRATPRRPGRWVAATVTLAGLLAVVGWRVQDARSPASAASQSGSPTAQPATTPSPTPQPSPESTTFEGPLLQEGIGAQVVMGGQQPAVVELPSGQAAPITGIRAGHQIESGVRVRGATILSAAGPLGDKPGAVYSLADGATAARLLTFRPASLALGETDETFWAIGPLGDPGPARSVVEERDGAGRLLRRVVLPKGWRLVRGVAGGVLLRRHAEITRLAVWDPARRRFVRELGNWDRVAESVDRVAWADPKCVTESGGCVLHVSDLQTGTKREVAVPDTYQPVVAAFSRDGQVLVTSLLGHAGQDGSIVAVTLETGSVEPLVGATWKGQRGIGAVIGWAPDGNAVVLAAPGGSQLAVWRRSEAGVEMVPGRFDGSWPVAVRPAG